MAQVFTDGNMKPARLECMNWGAGKPVVFEGTRGGHVLVKIGDAACLIARSELAAAAVLFPDENTVTVHIK